MRTNIRVTLIGLITLASVFPLHGEVDTTFDESVLHPNISLDIPNGSLAAITLDTVNEELDFATSGNTDMWVGRNNSPFAWTSRPPAAYGETWFVETELRYDTDVLSSKQRVAGITFYGGPDGSGGASQGMDFGFGINNWDDGSGDPGYQAAVEVQGFVDNMPGDLGANLKALWSSPSVFLRVEITELGVSDAYAFFYKANAEDDWTLLGTLSSTVDNSRVVLHFKNGDVTTAPDRSAAFTYFVVGAYPTVPALSTWALLILTMLLAAVGMYRP